MILKLHHASELMGGLVKHRQLSPTPRISDSVDLVPRTIALDDTLKFSHLCLSTTPAQQNAICGANIVSTIQQGFRPLFFHSITLSVLLLVPSWSQDSCHAASHCVCVQGTEVGQSQL